MENRGKLINSSAENDGGGALARRSRLKNGCHWYTGLGFTVITAQWQKKMRWIDMQSKRVDTLPVNLPDLGKVD
jgi:hypothetical protein